MLTCVPLLWTTDTAGTELQLHGLCQLFSSSFLPPPQAPSQSPSLRTNHKPPQPLRHISCVWGSWPQVHPEAKSRRKCTIITIKNI